MTIAAGFICSDGVLLASDTLYSHTGTGLKYGRKFWLIESGDVLVAFGGAGTESGMMRTRDEIAHRLKPGMSRVRVLDIIEAAIAKVHKKLKDPAWFTQGLVVVRKGGDSYLYQNVDGCSVLSQVQQCCQCVGIGAGLGWYFAHSMFRPEMNITWAKVIAAHLMKSVKHYSEGCGGDTHFLEIRPTDSAFNDDQSEIKRLEDYLGPVSDALLKILPIEGEAESTLDGRLATLKRAIQSVKNDLFVYVGPESIRLAGGQMTAAMMSAMNQEGTNLALFSSTPPAEPQDPKDPKHGQ